MVGMQEGCMVVGCCKKIFNENMGFLLDNFLHIFGGVYSGIPASI